MNEELDPKLMIQRLKQEITRLKAELAIARGENEGFPDGLPDYEKDKIKTAVSNYVKDTSPDSELIFSDFIKIQHAFSLLKDWVIGNDATPGVDGSKGGKHDYITTGMSAEQGTTFEKMKKLVEHRDNEISKIILM
jgi:kinesin family protein 6/9